MGVGDVATLALMTLFAVVAVRAWAVRQDSEYRDAELRWRQWDRAAAELDEAPTADRPAGGTPGVRNRRRGGR